MSAMPANIIENEQLVSYEALIAYTGFKEPAAVRSWLESNRIKYFVGKHSRPFTTLQAFNSGLGIDPNSQPAKREITL